MRNLTDLRIGRELANVYENSLSPLAADSEIESDAPLPVGRSPKKRLFQFIDAKTENMTAAEGFIQKTTRAVSVIHLG